MKINKVTMTGVKNMQDHNAMHDANITKTVCQVLEQNRQYKNYINKIVWLPKWGFIAKITMLEGCDEPQITDKNDRGISWEHLQPNGIEPTDLIIIGEYPRDKKLLKYNIKDITGESDFTSHETELQYKKNMQALIKKIKEENGKEH